MSLFQKESLKMGPKNIIQLPLQEAKINAQGEPLPPHKWDLCSPRFFVFPVFNPLFTSCLNGSHTLPINNPSRGVLNADRAIVETSLAAYPSVIRAAKPVSKTSQL